MRQRVKPSSELLLQFAERRDRMLQQASPKPIIYIAIGLVAFNLWDRWLDPDVATQTLWIRVAAAGMLLPLYRLQRLRVRSVRGARLLHAALFLIAVLGTAAATVQLEAGLVWGAPGICIFPAMLAVYTMPLRWISALNLLSLIAVAVLAVVATVPGAQIVNFVAMFVLACVVAHFVARILFNQQLRLFVLERHHAEEARTDALTGLLNRRMLEELGRRHVDAAHRLQRPLTALMLDIDHFKKVNDQFGHEVGDRALIAVADALRAAVRDIDILGRWGGEEFLGLLLDAGSAPGMEAANRCISAVRSTRLEHQGKRIPLDISVGVAELQLSDDLESLLRRADQALYAAKAAGRGRAILGKNDDAGAKPAS